MRANGVRELIENFSNFSHSKTSISFYMYILLVLLILCLRNIIIFRSQISFSFLLLHNGMALCINAKDFIPTKH